MSKDIRSDDYFDGLQVAFGIIYKLKKDCTVPAAERAYVMAMAEINQAIEDATKEDKPRIIIL